MAVISCQDLDFQATGRCPVVAGYDADGLVAAARQLVQCLALGEAELLGSGFMLMVKLEK